MNIPDAVNAAWQEGYEAGLLDGRLDAEADEVGAFEEGHAEGYAQACADLEQPVDTINPDQYTIDLDKAWPTP